MDVFNLAVFTNKIAINKHLFPIIAHNINITSYTQAIQLTIWLTHCKKEFPALDVYPFIAGKESKYICS